AVGVLRTLARAHMANGETALAEDTIRQAMEAAPNDMEVRVELAQLLAQSNRSEQAVTLLEEAVKKAPTNVQAREALVRAYISTKDLAQARTAVEDLKLAAPQAAAGPYLSGLIAESDKRYDDAEKDYAKAIELQPAA